MARVETGPMQFGDDWPGVFIRGDDAMHYARRVTRALELLPNGDGDTYSLRSALIGLAEILMSCDARKKIPDLTRIERDD